MQNKVKCNSCKNEVDAKCIIKNKSVSINKKRRCKQYDKDATKIKHKQQKPKVTRVPAVRDAKKRFSDIDVSELNKYLENERKALELKKEQLLKDKADRLYDLRNKYIGPLDSKHPLTGDLSRFKTSGD